MRPEITGDTENGRSISVISTLLPRKCELGDGPRGRDAEHEVERHGDRRGEQREPDRRRASGSRDRCEVDAEALAQRLDEHERQRHEQEQREEGQRDADEQQRTNGGSPAAGARASGRRG